MRGGQELTRQFVHRTALKTRATTPVLKPSEYAPFQRIRRVHAQGNRACSELLTVVLSLHGKRQVPNAERRQLVGQVVAGWADDDLRPEIPTCRQWSLEARHPASRVLAHFEALLT